MAVPANCPEYRPFRNPGRREPVIKRAYGANAASTKRDRHSTSRALLIGLAPADRKDDPLGHSRDIVAINCNEFGAPKRSGCPPSSTVRQVAGFS